VFHHLRKFLRLEIQKLGWSTIPSKNWANNLWQGADKFLMEGAVRRKIGEINFGKVSGDYLKP
jgi:hypothetical protein